MCGILQRGIPESPVSSGALARPVAAGLNQVHTCQSRRSH